MVALDSTGKQIFSLMATLYAGANLSRQAERSVSGAHYPAIASAILQSLDLCENAYDATMTMLRTRDMQASLNMVELASASPLMLTVPSSDPAAAKVALRALHEAAQAAWTSLGASLTGAEAISAAAFASSHGVFAGKFGVSNGSPEIA